MNRRRVRANSLVDVVCSTIGGYGAHMGCSSAGIVGTERIADVVLDEGVGGPSVESKIRISSRVEGTTIGDCPEITMLF